MARSSIKIRAKIALTGRLMRVDGDEIEVAFPAETRPKPGSVIYIDQLLAYKADPDDEESDTLKVDFEAHFRVASQVDNDVVRAKLKALDKGSMSDLKSTVDQEIAPWVGFRGPEITTVKAIMTHPMESGLRKSKETGELVPAHFIQKVVAKHNGKIVLTAYWGGGVSTNPYLSFKFRGGARRDEIELSWADNKGASDSATTKIS